MRMSTATHTRTQTQAQGPTVSMMDDFKSQSHQTTTAHISHQIFSVCVCVCAVRTKDPLHPFRHHCVYRYRFSLSVALYACHHL